MDRGKLLRILLRQPCMYRDVVVLCKLLCCSKALGDLAMECFSGRVLLHSKVLSDNRAMQLQQWLSKHGECLQELHVLRDPKLELLELDPSVHQDLVQAQAVGFRVWDLAIESGLQQAAAAAPWGLQLQSLRFVRSGLSHATVLPHLSANLLTQLELHLDVRQVVPKQVYATVLSNLARLTNLHHLVFDDRLAPYDAVGHFAVGQTPLQATVGAAFSGLQHLTYLELRARVTVADAAVLPASLVELKLSCSPNRDQELLPYLQLGHLTALTHLHMGYEVAASLEAGDMLPPNMKRLVVQDEVMSSEPFKRLFHLEELHMSDCNLSAQDLLQLTTLTALTALGMSYLEKAETGATGSGVQQADAAAHLWKQLPLVELSLQVDSVAWPTVEAIRDLTKLTHLYIAWCKFAVVPHALAGHLRQWTSLRQLWMDDWTVADEAMQQVEGVTAVQADDMDITTCDELAGQDDDTTVLAEAAPARQADPDERVSVVAAIAELPDLQNLSLFGKRWGAALPGLVAATQLTKLILDACNLDDGTVTALASSLTGLRDFSLPMRAADSLSVSYSSACLPALAGLQHLTALCLNTNTLDVECLSQYPQLEKLLTRVF